MTLGERIKQRRLELGLSQMELAEKLGYVSKATISNAEHDRDDMTTTRIERYAEALGVTPAYLMGWEDSVTIEPEIKPDKERLNKVINTYAKKIHELNIYVSQLNEQGIEELTKHAKLMSNSEDYRKEDST